MRNKIKVGITYGDPCGIGPEILVKTLNKWNQFNFKNIIPVIIGSKKLLIKNHISKKILKRINIIEKNNTYPNFQARRPNVLSGKHALDNLRHSVNLARAKKVCAIITCPVSKLFVSSSNKKFKGQTDEIAKLCGINPESVIMLFVANDFRVALFTRHIPLNQVSKKIKKNKLKKFINLLNKELKKWFHIKNPKIAVLGLNPHAGEEGLFGNEEKEIILPVINSLKQRGMKVSGPFSPDAALACAGKMFLKNKKQPYDVYISFYHDQALPLFKAIAGYEGLNITLGLPFLRVSPDHGTAFDIAGNDKADNNGIVSALKLLGSVLKS